MGEIERRHEQISELFAAAAALDAAHRSQFLAAACGADEALRHELTSLLSAGAAAPRLFDTGAMRQVVGEPVPSSIGPYRVLRTLGEGGMGVVLLAEQEHPIRRKVAVKLIRPGIETKSILARFHHERQALALMSHPNIAQVFDAGMTENGRPYFVLEYVEDSAPITHYCDRSRLPLRKRLELFCQVCDAIQHAHQKAIIHRDIKPSNVLVTTVGSRPVPKIIDFGIAKPLTAEGFDTFRGTSQVGWLGTPEYMSPEQVRSAGRSVDTRTDVYALGVLLYELLVGALPFDEAEDRSDMGLMSRILSESEPSRPSVRARKMENGPTRAAQRAEHSPSALARKLRGELDWMVMTAIARDPDQRYASPRELAADIDRYLRNEPIQAGPPSRIYRLRKFSTKHRTGLALGACLLLLVLGFAAAVVLQARRTARERDRANLQAATAENALSFLVDVYGMPLEAMRPAGGATRLEAILERHDAVQTHTQSGGVEIATLFDKLFENLGRAYGEDHPETLAAKRRVAESYHRAFRLEEAELLLLETLSDCRRALGNEHVETLRAQIELGRVYTRLGRFDEAEAMIRPPLLAMRRLLGDEHPDTLHASGYLGSLFGWQGRWDEAGAVLDENIGAMRRVLGEFHRSTLAALYNLGCAAAQRGDRVQAIDYVRRALEAGFYYARQRPQGDYVYLRQGVLEDPDLGPLHEDPAFQALLADDGPIAAFWAARLNASYGELNTAKRDLRRALDRGYSRGDWLPLDPFLGALHGDPEFEALVQRARPNGLSRQDDPGSTGDVLH